MGNRRPVLLRLLLRLYPKEYRQRYGEEIRACFLADLDAHGGNPYFWLASIADHLGSAARVRRRSVNRRGLLRSTREDLVNAVRSLRRAPLFSSFAAMTLALGICAATAAFAVLDAIVLDPLPYPDSERLVLLAGRGGEPFPDRPRPLSAPLVAALQSAPGPAEAIAAATTGTVVLSSPGEPAKVGVVEVTASFFEVLGASARVGRVLDERDHVQGAEAVAVLGHEHWMTRFGGDAGVVGRTIVLDGRHRIVVGILDKRFVPPETLVGGVSSADVWVPFLLAEHREEYSLYLLDPIARLRPTATADEMNTHLAATFDALYRDRPHERTGTSVLHLEKHTVGDVAPVLWSAFAAVGILLVLSLVNLTSLLLARGTQRAHDLAIRAAIGAGRLRLVRELVSEGAVLALVGGALGAGLAFLAVTAFRRYAPGGIPRIGEVGLDAHALAFAGTATSAAVLLTSLAPALRLAAGSTASARSRLQRNDNGRARAALVFTATAVSVVSLATSGLLLRDLARRVAENPGYRPEGLISVRVDLPAERYPIPRRVAFWNRLLGEFQTMPGVMSAALASELPTTGFSTARGLVPEGHADRSVISTVNVSPEYRTTIGLPVIAGRWFTVGDSVGRLAEVNEAFVREYWPESPNPVGLQLSAGPTTYRVVGLTRDARVSPGVGPRAKVYLLLEGFLPFPMEVVARVSDPGRLAPVLGAMVQQLDPQLIDAQVRTVESLIDASLTRPRFYTVVFSCFGLLALLLALVGIYGTTAYATRARTREITIQMALGAHRADVVAAIVVRMGGIVLGGVVVGLALAALGSDALTEVLLTITPRDSLTYALVAATTIATGLVAALWPAWWATRVDLASALKNN